MYLFFQADSYFKISIFALILSTKFLALSPLFPYILEATSFALKNFYSCVTFYFFIIFFI